MKEIIKIKILGLLAITILFTSCDKQQSWGETTKEIEVTFKLVKASNDPPQIELEENVLILPSDIKGATVVKNHIGRINVALEMTEEGRKKFSEITQNNTGRRIAILFNDQVISTPEILGQIQNGKAQVSGHFSEEECNEMVRGIMKYQFNHAH